MQLSNLMNLLAGQSNNRIFSLPASRPAARPTPRLAPLCGKSCEDSRSAIDKYSPGPSDLNKDQTGLNQTPDGTYYYRREARLDYNLSLSFDLAAVARVAAQIENGELTEAEALLAGGFGLHADFQASGSQTVETNATDENQGDSATRSKSKSRSVQGQAMAARYGDNERGFALEMFRRDATSVRRSLKSSVRDGHQKTTNKIALRFQSDTRFSFALAQRFNVQTQQVAEQTPESLANYLKSTGEVADSGSADMMAKFFDAVDAYLQGSYEEIKSRTGAFLDQAAGELGFSGGLVDVARAQLADSIDRFFGNVTDAVAVLAQQFGGTHETATPAVAPTVSGGGKAAPIGYLKAGPTETISSHLAVA